MIQALILSQDCCRLGFTYVLTMVIFFTIILVCHIPQIFKMLTLATVNL